MMSMFSRYKKIDKSRGIGLIEGVIAVAIVGTSLVSMVGAFNLFLRNALRTTPEVKAVFLVEESFEAFRSIRDINWDTEISVLTNDTAYHLIFEGGRWNVDTIPSYVDGVYERTITLSEVNRDNDGRIVATGGNLDIGTKLVTVSVAWFSGSATTTKTASSYVTDLFADPE